MTLNVNGLFPGELNPSTTVAGCIDIFENVWPDPEVTIDLVEKECKNVLSDVHWERASTMGAGQYQNYRTNRLLPITHYSRIYNNDLLQNIHNQFYVMLLAAVIPYTQRYRIDEKIYFEDYSLLKYQSNEEYKLHYDGGTAIGRAISAICYLNSDYEGGELEFTNFNLKIKPEAGMLILFPSNYAYAHISNPIISGTKYNLVTWGRDREM
jgi:predicted 2-oxoglutarate/Fe(II)-dependent dioxygenase YbiX